MIVSLGWGPWTGIVVSLMASILASFYLTFRRWIATRPPIFDAPKLYEERGAKDLKSLHSIVKHEFQKVCKPSLQDTNCTNKSQYRGTIFKLGESHGETVILPTRFMDELKALPDHLLNLDDEIDEVSLSNFSSYHRFLCGILIYRDTSLSIV